MPSYEEVTQRARSLRSVTRVTEKEFQALLPHFAHAFEAYMGNRTIDGHPRPSRRYTTYASCPLPTMADKLLFILTYLKQNPIQEAIINVESVYWNGYRSPSAQVRPRF